MPVARHMARICCDIRSSTFGPSKMSRLYSAELLPPLTLGKPPALSGSLNPSGRQILIQTDTQDSLTPDIHR